MIRIISFGYGHAPAPTADLVLDVRALLRNPFHDPALKTLTGLDQEVYDHVRDTPGAERLAFNAVATARGLAEDTGADVTVAWGCTGGRHRSVGLARLSYELLLGVGADVTIEHRDVDQALLPAGVHNREPKAHPTTGGLMTIVGRHTDSHGRSTGERVAGVHRYGGPITDEQRTAATRLLDALLDAAAAHGATLDDFDAVVDLPGGCLDVILSKTRH
ncbi:RNase adapter RapZ [Streptomyces rubradiris]|uniref:RapZ C-terminal domain-containing protein n=1 Tax=Streptomyces rubradiris TaxID=285531 RepID=UPI0033C5CC22